ncbi:hypothetical protein GCM10012320_17690 [Sinomonas cellulolyticus]|nr:hypothetical protein GCM10012320_17690 [Sinomonas sp. KCTC 49339]
MARRAVGPDRLWARYQPEASLRGSAFDSLDLAEGKCDVAARGSSSDVLVHRVKTGARHAIQLARLLRSDDPTVGRSPHATLPHARDDCRTDLMQALEPAAAARQRLSGPGRLNRRP